MPIALTTPYCPWPEGPESPGTTYPKAKITRLVITVDDSDPSGTVEVSFGTTVGGVWSAPIPTPPTGGDVVSGAEMAAIMAVEALTDETLYDHIKRVLYEHLQNKFPHLAGTIE